MACCGMAAVCSTAHFVDCLAAQADGGSLERARLMAMDPARLDVMFPAQQDVDVADEVPWVAREGEIAAHLVDFLGSARR